MNTQKLVSKKSGEVAEVVKVENGVYTLLVQGKKIEVKESTIKRWWKKQEVKEVKKEIPVVSKEVKKETIKVQKKNAKTEKKNSKKEAKKEESKNEKLNSSKKKIIKVKTSFPLRSYWNFCIYGRYKDLRTGIAKLNPEQKKQLIEYFIANDKNSKHTKWLKKEGLMK